MGMKFLQNKTKTRIISCFVIFVTILWFLPMNLINAEGSSTSPEPASAASETTADNSLESGATGETSAQPPESQATETTVETTPGEVTETTPGGVTETTSQDSTEPIGGGAAETTIPETTVETVPKVEKDVNLILEVIMPDVEISAGTSFKYIIKLTNSGQTDANNVLVKSQLPENISCIVSPFGRFDEITNTISWNIGKFAAGESIILEAEAGISSVIADGLLKTVKTTASCDELLIPGSILTDFTVKNAPLTLSKESTSAEDEIIPGADTGNSAETDETVETTGETLTTETAETTEETIETTPESTTEESITEESTEASETIVTEDTGITTTGTAQTEMLTAPEVANPLVITMSDNPDPVGPGTKCDLYYKLYKFGIASFNRGYYY